MSEFRIKENPLLNQAIKRGQELIKEKEELNKKIKKLENTNLNILNLIEAVDLENFTIINLSFENIMQMNGALKNIRKLLKWRK